MAICHSWLHVFDNDHWSAYSTTVAGDVYCTVMVIDVHTNKFANLTRPTQSPEVLHETRWVARQTYDGAVDHDDITTLTVHLRASSQANIYHERKEERLKLVRPRKMTFGETYPRHQEQRQFE